jgi:hypothetical protein
MKIKEKKWYKISRVILNSATIAFVLSVVFFAFEMYESEKETKEVVDNLMQVQTSVQDGNKKTEDMINNLLEIQKSISTKYLGLFPAYIDDINVLLEGALAQHSNSTPQDSVIIFEDVLYYGIKSNADGFRRMNYNLLKLAEQGCHITIAYYDIEGIPFDKMLTDALIAPKYHKSYRQSFTKYMESMDSFNVAREKIQHLPNTALYETSIIELAKEHFPEIYQHELQNQDSEVLLRKRLSRAIRNVTYTDSISKEIYFDSTKVFFPEKLQDNIQGYLTPIPLDTKNNDSLTIRVNQMCCDLDDIKKKYLSKPFKDIHFADYKNMYTEMTQRILELLQSSPHIELVPLNETLMMSCWLTNVGHSDCAIFAFPSKYTTEEIGFISQDIAFSRYIRTMLNGIKK